MSVVSSSCRRVSLLVLGMLVSVSLFALVGCGGEKEVDPYVYSSLRSVMQGDTLSYDFLFEIDAPQFDYVQGNTGIVRDGNLLEFVVGTDLENQYRSYSGALLGVQKFFKPTSHLMIKRVKKAGVPQPVDSCASFVMPRMLRASQVDLETPGAALPDLAWNRKSDFATYRPDEEGNEKQIQTGIERFVFVPKHTLPDSVLANPSAKDMTWYAVFENSTLEIVDLTPGAEWMLHMLLEKDLPLVGSFTVTELIDSFRERKVEYEGLGHVIGKVKINWFRYANSFVKGNADFAM